MAENKSVQIESLGLPRSIHLVPMDYVDGFTVRPGFYEINGATAISPVEIVFHHPIGANWQLQCMRSFILSQMKGKKLYLLQRMIIIRFNQCMP